LVRHSEATLLGDQREKERGTLEGRGEFQTASHVTESGFESQALGGNVARGSKRNKRGTLEGRRELQTASYPTEGSRLERIF